MFYNYPKAGVKEIEKTKFYISLIQMNSQYPSEIEIIYVSLVKLTPERMSGREKKFYFIIIKFTLPEVPNKAVSRGVTFYR